MKRLASNGGFSLVELLTVIIIMGILMALVVYSVNKWLPNMQIAGASQQLLGAVGQARLTAATKSALVKLELFLPDSYIITMKDPRDTVFAGGNWIRQGSGRLQNGVQFILRNDPETYNFWRDGSLQAIPAQQPQIQCIRKPSLIRTLFVMRSTGLAEIR